MGLKAILEEILLLSGQPQNNTGEQVDKAECRLTKLLTPTLWHDGPLSSTVQNTPEYVSRWMEKFKRRQRHN